MLDILLLGLLYGLPIEMPLDVYSFLSETLFYFSSQRGATGFAAGFGADSSAGTSNSTSGSLSRNGRYAATDATTAIDAA